MNYKSVKETAQIIGISERMLRSYCESGRIAGAIKVGKSWLIPEGVQKPQRATKYLISNNPLLQRLREEKSVKLRGGIYHRTQIELCYNSNHIEGSTLNHEQTGLIYETRTIGTGENAVNVDDIIETANHFRCFDYVLDNAEEPLSEDMIKRLHFLLKSGTSDSDKPWFAVGSYKKYPNSVGNKETCPPSEVKKRISELLASYNSKPDKGIEDIIEFHYAFESLHPFQDGNGRVGRLIMFKECLALGVCPFIVDESHKIYYYRGLKEWETERGFLIDTCLSCQDKYKALLTYFEIPH